MLKKKQKTPNPPGAEMVVEVPVLKQRKTSCGATLMQIQGVFL